MKLLYQPNCLCLDFYIKGKDISTFLAASVCERNPDKYRNVLWIHLKWKYFVLIGKHISKQGIYRKKVRIVSVICQYYNAV